MQKMAEGSRRFVAAGTCNAETKNKINIDFLNIHITIPHSSTYNIKKLWTTNLPYKGVFDSCLVKTYDNFTSDLDHWYPHLT